MLELIKEDSICECQDGVPAAHYQGCESDGQKKCASCDFGFHLSSNSCLQNQCTCSNGNGTVGKSCPADKAAKCGSCNSGHNLSGDLCAENQCTCSNGDGAKGNDCSAHNAAKCSSCNRDFFLSSDECLQSVFDDQYLMYTMYDSQTIYSYTLHADQAPLKNGQFTIPYSTAFPGLSFNHGY